MSSGKSKVNVLIVLLCLFSVSYCLWSDIVYTASLSITQVVPTPNDPPFVSGNAVCTYKQSDIDPTLQCKVQHDVTIVTGIQIGVAPRNNLGTTIFNFSSSSFSAFSEETFTFVNTSNYQIDSQIDDFLNGLWYIQLISDDYPEGILRGQLEHTSRGYSIMSVANTVPRASGSTATGIALIDFSFYDPDRFLQIDIVNNIATPTGTEIRFGLPGQAGDLIYEFDTTFSPQFDSVTLTVSEETDFLDDLYYLNILSKINPSGEIRGQLTTIDYPNNVGFTARLAGLSGSSNETNNLGCAIVGFNCLTRVIEMLIMHNVPDANGGYVAASNTQGQNVPIFSLPSSQSPIFVSQKLTPQQEYYLFSQVLTVTITSPDFPQGEITGEISVKYDFYAYLSGSNIVPPVTTSAVGCVTLTLDKNNELDYSIFHTVKSPTEVNLNYGNEGQNGVVADVFPSVVSPIRGTTFQLSDNELQALVYDQIYISVNSENYPYLGEIRGQIKRVAPCTESQDNVFSVVQTSLNQNGGNYGGGNAVTSSSSSLFSFISIIAIVVSIMFVI